MKKLLTNYELYRTEKFKFIRTVLIYISSISILLAVVFGIISNIEIYAATENINKAVKLLFVIFLILGIIGIFVITYLIITYRLERKDYYKTRRKSNLKTKIGAFDVINYIWMGIFCFLCLYPIFYVLIGSFNQGADYDKGGVYFFTRIFTLENYKSVLEDDQLWQSYLITILRTSIGTITALVYTSIVAYAMSRSNLKFKKIIYAINIITMFFGGGLVPYFLIIKSLGLLNNFLVYIIPALYSVYNMIVMSSFFKGISNEIHEAAIVDGANEFRIWWQIYVPLSKPVIATIALWLSIGHWNSYIDTMYYINDKKLFPLQYYLYNVINSHTLREGMPETMILAVSSSTVTLATIIISIIPVLFFFPFIRKNFQSGIMVGSLKG